jgi:hypothetical protein
MAKGREILNWKGWNTEEEAKKEGENDKIRK